MNDEPIAWQQSSTTLKLCFLAIAIIDSISQGCPYKWTGMIAFVFGVIASSIFLGSILNVSGSISTKTGLAPTMPIASAVATNVNAVVITSSPAPISKALNAMWSASVPEFNATVYLHPMYCANSLSKALTFGPRI